MLDLYTETDALIKVFHGILMYRGTSGIAPFLLVLEHLSRDSAYQVEALPEQPCLAQ